MKPELSGRVVKPCEEPVSAPREGYCSDDPGVGRGLKLEGYGEAESSRLPRLDGPAPPRAKLSAAEGRW